MSAPILAIDPGHDGAAILLAADGRRVLGVWAWKELSRKGGSVWRFDRDHCLESLTMSSLHYVAIEISDDVRTLGAHLVVEGLFVWPGRTHGIIELAEAVGELIGPLRDGAESIERPAPSMWRSAVLPRGWGRSSEESERAALVVARTMHWPSERWVQSLDDTREPRWPHVVEAACIARWGWVQQQAPAQPALVASKRRRS